MLKKLFVAGGIVLYSLSSLGCDTKQTGESWEMGENLYSIANESVYTENIVTTFHNILSDFHSQDSKVTEPDMQLYNSREEYDSATQKFRQSRVDLFKNGENSLLLLHRRAKKGEKTSLLLHKEDEIVGGTYISFEEKGKTIRMICDGYKDLPFMELNYARKRMIEELSSSKNFPKAQRLVVFSEAYSRHSLALRLLGFKESVYTMEEHPADQYTCFELTFS